MNQMARRFEMVLVRHGETEANKSHIIQGHMDVQLNDVGLSQANLVAKSLANQHFDLAISSDLMRANQTAEAIRRENASLKSGPEVEQWPEAKERCFGEFEGKNVEELMAVTTSMNRDELFKWGPKDGETGQAFRERTKVFMKKLCSRVLELEAGEKPIVLVVSHGGFIRELAFHLVKDLNCEMPCKHGEYGRISPNTGVTRCEFELGEDGGVSKAVCTLLYSKEHLVGMQQKEAVLYGV